MCDKCGNRGLLPFKNKKGVIVKNTFLHCSCHPVYGDNTEPERYRPASPDMFDFPMSDIFRAASFEYCGEPDPGYIPPEPEAPVPEEQVIVHRHSDMGKLEYDLLQQTARRAIHLENKVNELTKPKSKSQPKPSGYKGIK